LRPIGLGECGAGSPPSLRAACRLLGPANKAGPFFGSPVGDGADSDAQGWQAVMARTNSLCCTEHQNPAGLATAPAGVCFVGLNTRDVCRAARKAPTRGLGS